MKEDSEKRTEQIVDLESRVQPSDHLALRLWLRLLAATTHIETEIRRRLRETFGITLARFDLMSQLERYPAGLRMGELSRRMMVSGGNVTGISDQLENEGLVVRVTEPNDRRAYRLKLTAQGRATFASMAAQHEIWIIELMAPLNAMEQKRLYDMLGVQKRGAYRANDRAAHGDA